MSTTVMEISISKYYPLIKPTKIPWKICKINQEYHVIPEIKGLLKKKKRDVCPKNIATDLKEF